MRTILDVNIRCKDESSLENMTVHAHFCRRATLTSKLGQTDLVSAVRSGFISRSMHARLQVSVCIGYNLCHPG